ncbi:MAG: response regulator [Nitrospinae bacterium]|nr:response regulator [Nitrospinota bacterium]
MAGINKHFKEAVILLVEDSPADQELVRRVMERSKIRNELLIVEDGVEAMAYLKNEGKYSDTSRFPKPDLVLLDINMPRMDGKQVLSEIRRDPGLKSVPVIILTTSTSEKDVFEAYHLGANAFISKPVDFEGFTDAIRQMESFWLMVATLPPKTVF